MKCFAIPNLAANVATLCVPWEFTPSVDLSIARDKNYRKNWANIPTLQHQCYSFWEPLNPGLRVNKENEPVFLHGFVADYDVPMDDADIQKAVDRAGEYVPQYVEKSLSGNCRFVWVFHTPLSVCSPDHATAIARILRKKLNLMKLAPGLDTSAADRYSIYFTNSCEWLATGSDLIPDKVLQGWAMECAEQFHWEKMGEADIPVEIIAAKVEEKFPNRWTGAFELGARGVRFWDAGADNDTAAIVRQGGMQCFTGPQPFVSWQNIFGPQWVDQFRSNRMGEATEGVAFDGRQYWRKESSGRWMSFSKDDMALHLAVSKHLSPVPLHGEPSEVQRTLYYIQNHLNVAGACPLIAQPEGIVHVSGANFLNICTRRVMGPANGVQTWGASGNFPWISKFLENFFDPPEQLDFFVSWLSRYYRGFYEFRPEQGQAVFIAGPPDKGKTLLSNVIISGLMNGHAPAESYLSGFTMFNSQLFEVGLWTVDDSTPTANEAKHKMYSAMIKRVVANTTFEYHAKFRNAESIPWPGRVIITCNTDPESIREMPDLDHSNADKLMIFKTSGAQMEFPARYELKATIMRELPFFARYILDYEIPDHAKGSVRFGVKAYHEASLVNISLSSSVSAMTKELLSLWAENFFKDLTIQNWEGTASELVQAMANDASLTHLMKGVTASSMSRALVKMQNQLNSEITAEFEAGSRKFKLTKNLNMHGVAKNE